MRSPTAKFLDCSISKGEPEQLKAVTPTTKSNNCCGGTSQELHLWLCGRTGTPVGPALLPEKADLALHYLQLVIGGILKQESMYLHILGHGCCAGTT